MNEQEMTTEEILSSIRQMLSDELRTEKKVDVLPAVSDMANIFILTPEMRCSEDDILKEKMQRVLEKMSQQTSDNSQTLD